MNQVSVIKIFPMVSHMLKGDKLWHWRKPDSTDGGSSNNLSALDRFCLQRTLLVLTPLKEHVFIHKHTRVYV